MDIKDFLDNVRVVSIGYDALSSYELDDQYTKDTFDHAKQYVGKVGKLVDIPWPNFGIGVVEFCNGDEILVVIPFDIVSTNDRLTEKEYLPDIDIDDIKHIYESLTLDERNFADSIFKDVYSKYWNTQTIEYIWEEVIDITLIRYKKYKLKYLRDTDHS